MNPIQNTNNLFVITSGNIPNFITYWETFFLDNPECIQENDDGTLFIMINIEKKPHHLITAEEVRALFIYLEQRDFFTDISGFYMKNIVFTKESLEEFFLCLSNSKTYTQLSLSNIQILNTNDLYSDDSESFCNLTNLSKVTHLTTLSLKFTAAPRAYLEAFSQILRNNPITTFDFISFEGCRSTDMEDFFKHLSDCKTIQTLTIKRVDFQEETLIKLALAIGALPNLESLCLTDILCDDWETFCPALTNGRLKKLFLMTIEHVENPFFTTLLEKNTALTHLSITHTGIDTPELTSKLDAFAKARPQEIEPLVITIDQDNQEGSTQGYASNMIEAFNVRSFTSEPINADLREASELFEEKIKGQNFITQIKMNDQLSSYADIITFQSNNPEVTRIVHAHALQAVLEKSGFHFTPIEKDGNCLFASVLYLLKQHNMPSHDCEDANHFRLKVVEQMRADDTLLYFLDETDIQAPQEASLEEKWELYCQDRSQDKVWGGPIEVTMITKWLNIQIHIFDPQHSYEVADGELKANEDLIFGEAGKPIIYLFRALDHYTAINKQSLPVGVKRPIDKTKEPALKKQALTTTSSQQLTDYSPLTVTEERFGMALESMDEKIPDTSPF